MIYLIVLMAQPYQQPYAAAPGDTQAPHNPYSNAPQVAAQPVYNPYTDAPQVAAQPVYPAAQPGYNPASAPPMQQQYAPTPPTVPLALPPVSMLRRYLQPPPQQQFGQQQQYQGQPAYPGGQQTIVVQQVCVNRYAPARACTLLYDRCTPPRHLIYRTG